MIATISRGALAANRYLFAVREAARERRRELIRFVLLAIGIFIASDSLCRLLLSWSQLWR